MIETRPPRCKNARHHTSPAPAPIHQHNIDTTRHRWLHSPLTVRCRSGEMADTHGSGPCASDGVEVQVLSPAPSLNFLSNWGHWIYRWPQFAFPGCDIPVMLPPPPVRVVLTLVQGSPPIFTVISGIPHPLAIADGLVCRAVGCGPRKIGTVRGRLGPGSRDSSSIIIYFGRTPC